MACFIQCFWTPVDVHASSYHGLLVRLSDVRVVGPGRLGVGVPHHLRCAVVLLQQLLGLQLICVLIWAVEGVETEYHAYSQAQSWGIEKSLVDDELIIDLMFIDKP